jgi:hypothetical protein
MAGIRVVQMAVLFFVDRAENVANFSAEVLS